MLKTTRLLPTKLALRYTVLMSVGVLQVARLASRYHACMACCASGCRSQKRRSVLRAITCSHYTTLPDRAPRHNDFQRGRLTSGVTAGELAPSQSRLMPKHEPLRRSAMN